MHHYIEVGKTQRNGKNKVVHATVVIQQGIFLTYVQEQLQLRPLYIAYHDSRFCLAKPYIDNTNKPAHSSVILLNTSIEVQVPKTIITKRNSHIKGEIADILLNWIDIMYEEFQLKWKNSVSSNTLEKD